MPSKIASQFWCTSEIYCNTQSRVDSEELLKVGPVAPGSSESAALAHTLSTRDSSQQIARFGLLGASIGGSKEDGAVGPGGERIEPFGSFNLIAMAFNLLAMTSNPVSQPGAP